MGNKATCSGRGSIYIQTDQPFYNSGDTVTGKIHLEKEYKNKWNSSEVILQVKGYEKISWNDQVPVPEYDSKGKQKKKSQLTRPDTYSKIKTFFNTQFSMGYLSDYKKNSQFTFPFQFKLPDSLPATFHEAGIEQKCDYSAIIKYRVIALFVCSHSLLLKHKQELVIRKPLKTLTQNSTDKTLIKPSIFGCINQGNSQIKCYLERKSYLPGETAQLLIEIDNSQCGLDLTKITCNFVQRLKLTSTIPFFNGQKSFVRNLSFCVLDGVASRQKAIDKNCKSFEFLLCDQNGNNLPPSTNSSLIECEYSLNITAYFAGCFCSSSSEYEISVPLQILPPPLTFGEVSIPKDWNPTVNDINNIALRLGFSFQFFPPRPDTKKIDNVQPKFEPSPSMAQQMPKFQPF